MTPAASLPNSGALTEKLVALQPLPALAQYWLDIQCKALTPLQTALILWRTPADAAHHVVAKWPTVQADVDALTGFVQQRLAAGKTQFEVCAAPADAPAARQVVYFPFVLDGQLLGAFGAEMSAPAPATTRALLEWGALWFAYGLHSTVPSAPAQSGADLIKLMLASLEPPNFKQALPTFVNQLAATLGFQRVSLALMRSSGLKLMTISNNAHFDPHSSAARDITAAMTEALDQRSVIALPNPAPAQIEPITRAHHHLQTAGHANALLSIPIFIGARAFAVVTLERHGPTPLDADTVQRCYQAVTLTAPILDLKLALESSVLQRLAKQSRHFAARLFGPRHLKYKLGTAAAVALLGIAGFGTGAYHISADAVLEGRVQRIVSAPMDGFISNALVRPGDEVQAGQVLGQLDDKDLRLEQTRWENELQQHQKEAREAMAQHDPARINILGAQVQQAQAQLALLREKLQRTVITAPFAGLVLDGDLSQSHGAPVTRGDILFRLAPLQDYRLVLDVDERDITAVATGLPGQLRLTGLPEVTMQIRVKTVTPVANAHDGRNVFRVEAQLDDTVRWNRQLRPGMKGVARLDAGQRRLAWLWTHGLIDWCRVWSWSWLP